MDNALLERMAWQVVTRGNLLANRSKASRGQASDVNDEQARQAIRQALASLDLALTRLASTR